LGMGTPLSYMGEAVFISSRGFPSVSRNASARILGICPRAVLNRIRRRTLAAEHRGHMGSAVWLVPISALKATTVDRAAQRYGRIRRTWHGSRILICRGCRRERRLGMSQLCLQCEGVV